MDRANKRWGRDIKYRALGFKPISKHLQTGRRQKAGDRLSFIRLLCCSYDSHRGWLLSEMTDQMRCPPS